MEDMNEIFKPIQGFEDYKVSNLGNVLSTKGVRDKLLTPQKDALGYLHVRLYAKDTYEDVYPNGEKRPKLFKVHRLVLQTFNPKGETEERNQVNHKNGIKTDNRLDNLEWVSALENIRHSYDIGLCDNLCHERSRLRKKPVKVIFTDKSVQYYLSRIHAAMALDLSVMTVIKRIQDGKPLAIERLRGVRFEDCPKLPVGKTYEKLAGIEEKILEYRLRYWNPEKRRAKKDQLKLKNK